MTETISNEQVTEQEVQEIAQPNLSLQDLILVTQVIQLVSSRGGIRAEEMALVGGLYTKIVAFLEASGAITRDVPAQEATTEESSTEEAAQETEE